MQYDTQNTISGRWSIYIPKSLQSDQLAGSLAHLRRNFSFVLRQTMHDASIKSELWKSNLEIASTSPTLLDTKLTRRLPQVIFKSEESDLIAQGASDPRNRRRLIARARHGRAIRRPSVRPTSLHDIRGLRIANLGQQVELPFDEFASARGVDGAVEERVHVASDNVDGGAERGAGFLPGDERLRGRDGAGVAGARELGLRTGDEGRKAAGVNVPVEERFVADNDQLDEIPLAPRDDVVDLWAGAGDAG